MSDDNRQDINTDVSNEKRSKILRHFDRYKSVYEIFGVAVAIGLSAWANIISSKALKSTAESLRKQELEFRIRNRPYVILDGDPKFGDKVKYTSFEFTSDHKNVDDYTFPKSIGVQIQNISEIPAQQVQCTIVAYLSGKQANRTGVTTVSLARGVKQNISIGLQDEWYEAVKNGSEELSINYTITYSGMLGENSTAYQTSVKVIFDIKTNNIHYPEYYIK